MNTIITITFVALAAKYVLATPMLLTGPEDDTVVNDATANNKGAPAAAGSAEAPYTDLFFSFDHARGHAHPPSHTALSFIRIVENVEDARIVIETLQLNENIFKQFEADLQQRVVESKAKLDVVLKDFEQRPMDAALELPDLKELLQDLIKEIDLVKKLLTKDTAVFSGADKNPARLAVLMSHAGTFLNRIQRKFLPIYTEIMRHNDWLNTQKEMPELQLAHTHLQQLQSKLMQFATVTDQEEAAKIIVAAATSLTVIEGELKKIHFK